MKPEAFLFVSHTAARTGAPIELLRFLGWLKSHSNRRILVLLQEGGELEDAFSRKGQVRVWRRPLKTKIPWIRRILETLRWEGLANLMRMLRARHWIKGYDVKLVVANTAFVGDSLTALQFLACPRVCRVHEMEYALRNFRFPLGFRSFRETLKVCDGFIAVSEAVAGNLRENHGVDATRIQIVHGSVEPVNRKLYLNPDQILRMKRELEIPESSPVIGGVGWIQWGKGTDLFVQLAALMRRKYAGMECHFLWVGGDLAHERYRRLRYDVTRLGLEEYVHFVGHHADPFHYYAVFHVLAMLSREDSFPLVNPEVGLLGIPVVCFAGGGGSQDWAERGCGEVVPYLDIHAAAGRIAALLDDREKLDKMGRECRIQAENLLVEHNAPRLHGILEGIMSGEG